MSVAAILVQWPLEAAQRWLALPVVACNGLLIWRCRAELQPKPSGRWQRPTAAEQRAAWRVRFRILYLNPSADAVVRAVRPASFVLFALFLLTFVLDGIVIQSPYRSMLGR
jgi:hypothetical protein